MSLRHDLAARLAQRSRPRYGETLRLAGTDLPAPRVDRIATRHGAVRCLRYAGTTSGRYLHLHGGAFVTRFPEMDDFWARFVVATTGLEVVLPDYDVAPQARYPVAHEQVYDVATALADTPVVVGGFSAGGNLAASLGLWARDTGALDVRALLLGVPSLDVAESAAAKTARTPDGMVDASLLTLVRETYFRDGARRNDPYASPLRALSLVGVAPTMVVTAERDTLRPEGDAYAARLRTAGVEVEHVVAPGVDHHFLHGAGPDQARALMTRMATWLAAAARD